MYCPSKHLHQVRTYCNQKIEDALQNLYNFSLLRDGGNQAPLLRRMSTLQERMICAAKSAELQERPTVQGSKIIHATRPTNIAIKSRQEVELLVHLHKLPRSKLIEHDRFPLASQLGFIQAIPEADYDIASATITDVGFLGLFPIKIFQELRRYAKEVEHCTPAESTEFLHLFDQLICSFIYRPITIQKIIHFLIS